MVESGHRGCFKPRGAGGFTLMELMVTLVVAVVLLTIAIPSFSGMLTRQRLRAAAEQVRADLTLARTEAIKRNATVVTSFSRSSDGSTWCYGLSLNTGCDCTATTGSTVCFLDRADPADPTSAVLRRVVSSDQYRGVVLDAAVTAISFSPVRSTLVNRSISFTAGNRTARVITANMGRIRMCSPTGSNYLYYYDACS